MKSMKRILSAFVMIAVLVSSMAVSAFAKDCSGTYMQVYGTTYFLALRSSPAYSASNIIAELHNGDTVYVLDTGYGSANNYVYYLVKSDKGQGYVDGRYLKATTASNTSNDGTSWTVSKFITNTSRYDESTNAMDVSKYSTWYAHFKISGGQSGKKAYLTYKVFWPNGQVGSGVLGYYGNGDTGYINGSYDTPAYGASGSCTVKIYKAGIVIGTDTFWIY